MHNSSFPCYKVPISARGAPDLASALLLGPGREASGRNLSGLLNFADSEPAAVRWGEVIPLAFLGERVNTTCAPQPAAGFVNVSIFSIPTERYTTDVAMVCGSAALLRTSSSNVDSYLL